MRELAGEIPHPTLASNIFMNIAVTLDGRRRYAPDGDEACDYISGQMDCIVAFACPQDIVKIRGAGDNTPKDAHCCVLSTASRPLAPAPGAVTNAVCRMGSKAAA